MCEGCMFVLSQFRADGRRAEEGFSCLLMWKITHILCVLFSKGIIYRASTQRKCKISHQVLKVFPVHFHIYTIDLKAVLANAYDYE